MKYQYTQCGLDNVWLQGGVEIIKTPKGKEGVRIFDMDGLHRAIGGILTEKPERLTGAEFRFLRVELGLSRRLMAQALALEAENAFERVKKWEEARDEPIRDAYDPILRMIYRQTILEQDVDFMELVDELRNTDREWHEKVELTTDDDGWREAS